MRAYKKMKAVRQLGLEIERVWQASNYSEENFPGIATEALSRAALSEQLAPIDIVQWTLSTLELPQQADLEAKFGQPPVTLYRGRRFYIDALFWVDGTTSIHQHAFSGAFHVLDGSSIHTEYTFEVARAVNVGLKTGHLKTKAVTLCRKGLTLPICSGPQYIHSLFHLERPTVTIVARTKSDVATRPQYDYFKPSLAVDPFPEDEWTERALQMSELLLNIAHPDAERLLVDMIQRSDARTCFLLLTRVCRSARVEMLEALLGSARRHHAALIGDFESALEALRRSSLLVARRAHVTVPEQRFFLALLLSVERRSDLLRLTSTYYPGRDAAETIAQWICDLSRVTVKLQAADQIWEPRLLGLPECNESARDILKRFLIGQPIATEDAVFLEKIRRLVVFRPLFH